MLIYTETDKWKDDWFMSLQPIEKLLFIYLYENCDSAGFIHPNTGHIRKQLGLTHNNQVFHAFRPVMKAFKVSKHGKKQIWLKNYLRYQDKLPLNSNDKEDSKIIIRLKQNLSAFPDDEDILFILQNCIEEKVPSDTAKGISLDKKPTRKRKSFVKPSFDEWLAYFKEKDVDDESFAKQLYEHYEKVGWIVGRNKSPVKDWKACIRQAISKHQSRKDNTQNGFSSRTEKIINASNAFEDFDFNTLTQ